jgi:hypothetical protein
MIFSVILLISGSLSAQETNGNHPPLKASESSSFNPHNTEVKMTLKTGGGALAKTSEKKPTMPLKTGGSSNPQAKTAQGKSIPPLKQGSAGATQAKVNPPKPNPINPASLSNTPPLSSFAVGQGLTPTQPTDGLKKPPQ